jgi:phosphate transport system substrate-binding protein
MKATLYIIAACIIVLTVSNVAFSTGNGKVLIYGGAGQGKVIFDGRVHAAKGMVCNDCHTKIFETSKKALITMDDHSNEKACFVCHNGRKVFNDCEQCHRKF